MRTLTLARLSQAPAYRLVDVLIMAGLAAMLVMRLSQVAAAYA
ncbi:hypothetical protein [Alsobacter sp. SYSU BS001988]|jgi:hypothetical protein